MLNTGTPDKLVMEGQESFNTEDEEGNPLYYLSDICQPLCGSCAFMHYKNMPISLAVFYGINYVSDAKCSHCNNILPATDSISKD